MRACSRVAVTFALVLALLCCGGTARAQETSVVFDPAQTTIAFSVDSTLHLVRGTFHLKSGRMRWDVSTGQASGEIGVDAASGESGNDSRDKKMHNEILESPKYPEILFSPTRVKGAIPQQGTLQVDVDGVLRLHGQDHPMTLTFAVERGENGEVRATTHFGVPYTKWGLKNANAFLLRVNDTVQVEIHAVGHIEAAAAPASHL